MLGLLVFVHSIWNNILHLNAMFISTSPCFKNLIYKRLKRKFAVGFVVNCRCLLKEGAFGSRGAFHWSTWCPLSRQQFSSVIGPEPMTFLPATETAALCVETGRVFLPFSPLTSCAMRLLTWTPLRGESARSWASCRRGFPESVAHILDHISGSHFFFFFFLEVLVVLVAGSPAHQLLADWDCMMVAPQWNNWPVPSTLQPGTMKPGNRTLKFVILTALQALSAFMSACDGLPSGSAEGKMRWRSELSLNRAQR